MQLANLLVGKPILPISVIITVLNERQALKDTILSVARGQSIPAEVVVVDGGSFDGCWEWLQAISKENQRFNWLRVARLPGNRSVGRNFAVQLASQRLIAITDAGCVVSGNWLSALYQEHCQTGYQVVAGWAKAHCTSCLEKVFSLFFLPPANHWHTGSLPATRSMLISKEVWNNFGGLNPQANESEDYLLAKRLVSSGVRFAFSSKGIVKWQPPTSWSKFFVCHFRFAKSDAIFWLRPQSIIFAQLKFIFFLIWVMIAVQLVRQLARQLGWVLGEKDSLLALATRPNLLVIGNLTLILTVMFLAYVFYATYKHRKEQVRCWWLLALAQLVTDLAVLLGGWVGLVIRGWRVILGNVFVMA